MSQSSNILIIFLVLFLIGAAITVALVATIVYFVRKSNSKKAKQKEIDKMKIGDL